jgi:glutamine amidotransferase
MITIIDYGLGNLASVKNMIRKVGGKSEITADPEKIAKADKLILPGVGAFGVGIKNIRERGLEAIIKKRALQDKIPLLGICLGAQLLTNSSEESDDLGMALVNAETKRFKFEDVNIKVPHMGWNEIHPEKNDHPLFLDCRENQRFYFVHSYYMQCASNELLCSSNYGQTFASGIVNDNIMGVQFHPEKSHVFGMALMKNFISHF